ncbi:21313_t:CDS:2, partial [Racocetra persica]
FSAEQYQRLLKMSPLNLINNDNISELVEKFLTFDDYELNNAPTTQEEYIEHNEDSENNKPTTQMENSEHSENSENITSEEISKSIYFTTWDEVEDYLNDYGARNGFAITKYRVEKSNSGQIIKKTFVCEFSGKYKSKKKLEAALNGTQRNMKTKKTNCKWHINLSLSGASQISITTYAIDEVKLMTRHANLLLSTQKRLLKARFPDLNFQDQDLANVIQKVKKTAGPLFKERWNKLLTDFPIAKDYLLHVLDPKCRSWARAYLHRVFTAGIESTSRVESYNWVIKQQLKAN